MSPHARTAVVHLVRHASGPEPFKRFLASCRRFEPGIDCEPVLLFKGFPDPRDAAPYLDRAAGDAAGRRHVPTARCSLPAGYATSSAR